MDPVPNQLCSLPPLDYQATGSSTSELRNKDPRMSLGFIAPSSTDSPYKLAPLWNLPATDLTQLVSRDLPETFPQRATSPSSTTSTTSPTSSFSSISTSSAQSSHPCIEPPHSSHRHGSYSSDPVLHSSPYSSDPVLHSSPYPTPHHRSLSTEATLRLLRSRTPRAARPSYTERQKYYIMYARVVLDLSWPEIQRCFYQNYKLRRSKSGLCSVYYRTRKAWGMEEVLVKMNEGEDSMEGDRKIVLSRCKGLVGEGFW